MKILVNLCVLIYKYIKSLDMLSRNDDIHFLIISDVYSTHILKIEYILKKTLFLIKQIKKKNGMIENDFLWDDYI